ncbi:MAG TPA: NAD(P)H-dependent oxidoreductase [Novosphingobium sp.]|nr:NAD(P)H-dependent oxidoreductase [Novosphingobium sp.]
MTQLAIVWHSRTGASEQLAQAAAQGACAAGEASCVLVRAEDCAPSALLAAAGYLFVCPENLATMSGAMKEMFDRCYYPLLGAVEGRPYATIVAAGSDGHGALAQIDRIVTGWRLRRVAEPLIVNLRAQTPEAILTPKQVSPGALEQAKHLGEALSAGMTLGIF